MIPSMPGEALMSSWTPILLALGVGLIFGIRNYMRGPKCPSQVKLRGKTVVVTGANSGIGKEVAKDFALRGARVILACRDLDKGNAAAKELREASKNEQVICRQVDLASFQSIRTFVHTFIKEETRLDVLINNAGVMCHPQMMTDDNQELHFAANYLGPFLLTHLLLDRLKACAPSRIVNVTAVAYQLGEMNFDDLSMQNVPYNAGKAYSQSKLALVLFTRHMAKYLEGTGVTINAVHPGVVNTDVQRHMPFRNSTLLSITLAPFIWFFMKLPVDGAQTIIHCAVAETEKDVSGQYYVDCQIRDMTDNAKDDNVAKELWERSLKLTGVQLKE